MSITAKELAKTLNLSAAAVSMALNNKKGVSNETRNRVYEAAMQYGYNFSQLVEKRSEECNISFILYKRHGAVVANTPFFSQLFEGIEYGCKQERMKQHINYLHRGENVEQQLDTIIRSGCSGIILLGTEIFPEDLAAFMEVPLPIVLLDAYYDNMVFNCVSINNVQGAYLATDYLITKTCKHPGYLHSDYRIANFEERADGFYKAVRQHGLSTSKSIVHRLPPSVDGAYADMLAILDAGEDIAGCYFADNDWIAIGAMKAFQAKGYKIPDDIAIIGFDDVPLAGYVDPPITTVHVPKHYMGQITANRLKELINKRTLSPVKTEILTSLILRSSA